MPIVLMACFQLGKTSLNTELNLLANAYVRQLEEQIDDLRDENKQALYDATSCEQIQKDLLFESFLREMLIVDNGKVVCSSKRTTLEANSVEKLLPSHQINSGEYLFDFPYEKGVIRSLLVIDTDKNNPQRSAISVVDQSYINLHLGLTSDDRIQTLRMVVGGKTYPPHLTTGKQPYSTTAKSSYLNVEVTIEPSAKLKREKLSLFMLIGLPVSLSISMLFYLLQYWSESRGSLIESLKRGLKTDELFLVYQPLIDSTNNKIMGVEALLRWESSKHGFIRPDIFIPIAEQHNFINTITDFVLERALDDWKTVNHQNQLHIGVNIPASYLVDEQCLNKFKIFAKQFKSENLVLGIEITERQLLSEKGRAILSDVRALGIEVSIDDFGTGYTALSVLQDIKFDYLKIDRCFINTIGVESVNAPILNSIISLAHQLEVSIVAEGVETQQQSEYLTSQNVQILQGYYLYKPMPLEAIKNTLHNMI
ncbi:EAL domain-containing protein [Vibrio rumoiensis]|nr:EAL domain-containing protein [Vibrio rumoiensis]